MGGRRREGRGGLPGNVAEEAFCLKSAPGVNADCRPRTECLNGGWEQLHTPIDNRRSAHMLW